ncbi:type II toxin-antitoxin system VapC family toxin [Candidatus Thiothrix sp. Deng01]|uniref:Type II toxin-antitoxin system VapC family toxin n=1 Tax=Candidatus Thiothrix phosphatis TaxID=3112415 RepID=A0ABU6D2S7_9GAMM|nr:type II toxin-antitoxin system VapC family toxin [Candidatus Thiothrix sp. Deng01]MEB4592623.1 type II toxin-antitoxin system VapC family toxin [Candidatus Thiothrix sp. Deng01]
MIAVDTNLLVRYVVNDDREQALVAATFFDENPCLVQHTVLLETVWVLAAKSTYNMPREEVVSWIRRILGLPNVSIRDEKAVGKALEWYEGGMDFADALHFATSHDVKGFVTFDRRMRNKARQLNIPQNLIFLGKESH